MEFRPEYSPIISAVSTAGYFVTDMPLDSGHDRIVCVGLRRKAGGYTGNSFWFAERDGAWFLGVWGGSLYRLANEKIAISIAVEWLRLNSTITAGDVPDTLKLRHGLVEIIEEDTDWGIV